MRHNGRSGNGIRGTAKERTGSRSPASFENSTPGIGKVIGHLVCVCPCEPLCERVLLDEAVERGKWVVPDQIVLLVEQKEDSWCRNRSRFFLYCCCCGKPADFLLTDRATLCVMPFFALIMPFSDDQRDGLGVFFYADGGRYEGGWAANRRSGEGLMSFANGEVRAFVIVFQYQCAPEKATTVVPRNKHLTRRPSANPCRSSCLCMTSASTQFKLQVRGAEH